MRHGHATGPSCQSGRNLRVFCRTRKQHSMDFEAGLPLRRVYGRVAYFSFQGNERAVPRRGVSAPSARGRAGAHRRTRGNGRNAHPVLRPLPGVPRTGKSCAPRCGDDQRRMHGGTCSRAHSGADGGHACIPCIWDDGSLPPHFQPALAGIPPRPPKRWDTR